LRTGQIDEATRAASLNAFAGFVKDTLIILPISTRAFQTAARFADQSTLGIKSGDALHLAVAVEFGAVIATFDKRLVKSALTLGVAAELL